MNRVPPSSLMATSTARGSSDLFPGHRGPRDAKETAEGVAPPGRRRSWRLPDYRASPPGPKWRKSSPDRNLPLSPVWTSRRCSRCYAARIVSVSGSCGAGVVAHVILTAWGSATLHPAWRARAMVADRAASRGGPRRLSSSAVSVAAPGASREAPANCPPSSRTVGLTRLSTASERVTNPVQLGT